MTEPKLGAAGTEFRLRRHADYQCVYKASRKQFSKQMSYFFALRESGAEADARAGAGPRVGLTVGKVMGKAVDRNRIKRRMRSAVRRHVALLAADVDVVLHPKRTVLEVEFAALEREVGQVFKSVMKAMAR